MPRATYDNTAYLEAKSKLPKPDGKHCIICGKDLPKFKRKYCSWECKEKWFNKIAPARYWSDLRWRIFKRDNFTCQKCKTKFETDEKLEADHIMPVAMGGDMWDMNNIQTLCDECHVEKTRDDLQRIEDFKNIGYRIRDFFALIEERERNLKVWSHIVSY